MYFFALAAAGLMTACSSDDAVSNGGQPDETALVPIQIGVSPTEVITRGTGTVGGTTAETNKWNNEKVNVYMFNKGTMKLAKFEFDNEGGTTSHEIYNNKTLTAPVSTDSVVTLTDDEKDIEYYPMKGNFDFWGYRIDDATLLNETDGIDYTSGPVAVDAQGAKVEDAANAVAYVTKFTIDGSQDIMRGKATLTPAQKETMGGDADRVYSAFAARKKVQPVIDFEHLLTRFTFQVVPGSASAAGITDPEISGYKAVAVRGIKIKSKNTATLPVAYTGDDADNGITFADDVAELSLKASTAGDDGKLEDFPEAGISLEGTWNDGSATATNIGSALLVAPGETSYEMILTLSQDVPTSSDSENPNVQTKQQNLTLPIEIKVADGEEAKPFEAGHSYNVVITVYGLEQITVDANLSMWKPDANIGIDAQ